MAQQPWVLVALDHGLDHARAEFGARVARRMEERVLGEVRLHAVAEAARGDRVHAGARALARHEHVGHDAEMLERPQAAGASESRLHLIENQQRTVLVAQTTHLDEVALGRHEIAACSGDGLHDHGRRTGADRLPERRHIAEGHAHDVRA